MATAESGTASDIRVITEPEVYLVGKQMMGDAELSRFLADHGVSWGSDSEVPAEILTETAGRVCYLSFAKPRPGGNSFVGCRSAADRCPRALGTFVKAPEVQYHHEVYNQFLWNLF
jgi:hypothetical protein